jgi:23S rRNA (guanosine2251-2'-O)-methyltransferase
MARQNNYLVYGLHTVQTILERSPERVLSLHVDRARKDQRLSQIRALANRHGLSVEDTDSKQLDQRVDGAAHQGVVASVRPPVILGDKELFAALATLEHAPFLLVLDGVQDPHNLGACLRSADAAGVDAVIVPRDNACGLTATVSKVASGAAEVMPLYQITNLARTLRELQERNIWCIGLAGEAESSLYDTRLDGPLALVLGAEGKGLRRLTRETCDVLASLPMMGSVESLNVSVTAGVALYEALRQRQISR